MSTLAPTIEGMSGLILPARSTAQSEPAKRLDIMRERIRKHGLESYVMRNPAERALTELDELRAEASHKGWDGYGAQPLNPASFDFAIRFLNALPSAAPLPDVSADGDGEVSLDWVFGERQALTVSVGPTGRCIFAWMLGQRTYRGTDWIDDEIPDEIVSALGKLVRDKAGRATRST